jgi:RNA polymerase sigma factor (sigma-70 family)
VEAVERFEPGRRCSFRTFANRVTRRRIQDALRRIERDPLRHSSRDMEELEQLYVEESLAQDPDDVRLQAGIDPTDPGAASLLTLVAVFHGSACRALELRTRAMLFLSSVGRFRQREIAQLLGITEARVSQILREAKNHLSRSVSIRIDR